MIKTLKLLSKQEHEKFKVPKNVQDLIPVQKVYSDGIFQVAPGKFAK